MTSAILIAALVLTNATELAEAVARERLGTEFELEGLVTFTVGEHISQFPLVCGSDSISLFKIVDPKIYPRAANYPKAGDRILARGRIIVTRTGIAVPECTSIRLLSHEAPPLPTVVSADEILSQKVDCKPVTVRGTVREIFKDEIDPNWNYLSLNCDGTPLFVTIPDDGSGLAGLTPLSDCDVSVTGFCDSFYSGCRRLIGNCLTVADKNDFQVIHRAPDDPFSAPEIAENECPSPWDICRQGKRRIVGRVVAVWQENSALITSPAGKPHLIKLAGAPPPQYGDTIEAVGYPETDLYRINLSAAIWRTSAAKIQPANPAADISASDILTDKHGNQKINTTFHGQAIRLNGTIQDLPTRQSGQSIITLKSGEFTIPVDISANRPVLNGLDVGCLVSVSGTCVVETENWRPYAAFPHTTGITLVVRTPADVVILSRPSWWTPQRLMVVVGILLLVLVAIFIWNRILQRVIDRKSRQLLKEQVAQIKSELRVDERTHLAVELHDTLSQNLSGVACQIAATKGTLPEGADETARYLETAERMLLSCRTELRRCLWDLRGDTLEETNFTEAIRKTLAPVAIGVETIIRFNVPRSRLSDTTAHAVLCIIRELVANAIRHGKTRTVRVAGEFHDGVLSFSVRDDGRGFDPSNCNGPAEGHFGLEGIRERIKHLDGTFAITSEIGKGTRAEVTLASIQPKDEKPEA